MSQEKVDKYKLEKANRKETMKKQKAKHKRNKFIGSLVALSFVAWVGYSTYDLIDSLIPREEVVVDYAAFDEYLANLSNMVVE